MQPPKEIKRVISCIACAFILLILGGFALGTGIVNKGIEAKNPLETTGRITRIENHHSTGNGHDRTSTTAYVTFTDNRGIEHENVLYSSYAGTAIQGNEVVVYYVPGEYDMVYGPLMQYLTYGIYIGVAGLIIAMILIYFGVKTAKENNITLSELQKYKR